MSAIQLSVTEARESDLDSRESVYIASRTRVALAQYMGAIAFCICLIGIGNTVTFVQAFSPWIPTFIHGLVVSDLSITSDVADALIRGVIDVFLPFSDPSKHLRVEQNSTSSRKLTSIPYLVRANLITYMQLLPV